ncbi:peptidase family C78-domain-containing protein [Stachybotrys elegans]|uniref:Peptidase family C78-domain-containing protein n=1 Tax=Stachybotrys elegans TaxID=80388 RepID=A0A8K0STA3_9HYPO|nr:peptidase family C78-domain-containing protein [Stachybotrys elegans]
MMEEATDGGTSARASEDHVRRRKVNAKDSMHRRSSRRSRSNTRRQPETRSSQTSKSTLPWPWRKLFSSKTSDHSPPHRHHPGDRRKGDVNSASQVEESRTSRPKPPKLGKSELGRFANEKQMPRWLVSMLQKNGEVCESDILPVLKRLLSQSSITEHAYLCHPRVQHISKLKGEGGFCGYRNIQMLISNIVATRGCGSGRFGDRFPSVFEIQDLIEKAWDMGINAHGRLETGGIRGTRKFIGTPEAQALFRSLEIPCSVQALRSQDHIEANTMLLQAIEGYFRDGCDASDTSTVRLTALPPIYFQRRGHSMTIVGYEQLKNGNGQLLVFDPAYRDASSVRRLVHTEARCKAHEADYLLKAYRRGRRYLGRFNEFELLYLEPSPQSHASENATAAVQEASG